MKTPNQVRPSLRHEVNVLVHKDKEDGKKREWDCGNVVEWGHWSTQKS